MEPSDKQKIRNFSIVAHIDHGKSTLADRILEMTEAVSPRLMREQFLDSLELERERGITIKLKAIHLNYALNSSHYRLNLIDTPGHVDFGYEVSRSLAACEGAILVVDASQGIQAQTVANFYKAKENHLKIIPFINKIDLSAARPQEVANDLCQTFGLARGEIIFGSAKEGTGISQLLEAVVQRIPHPPGQSSRPLRALVFDSVFDDYKGVIAFVKVVDGRLDLKTDRQIRFLNSGVIATPLELGFLSPQPTKVEVLEGGEVGYIATGFKDIRQVKVGETITPVAAADRVEPLPGYQEPKPMVYLSLYPTGNNEFLKLRQSLEKLRLNDASLTLEAESSPALGLGFRCGFLGLLHAEIVQQRLERDYGLSLISTRPSVPYQVELTNGQKLEIHQSAALPDASSIRSVAEPFVKLFIFVPPSYTGSVLKLVTSYRARFLNSDYFSDLVRLSFEIPLVEIISDFYDRLKSASAGFASLDYELIGYRVSDLCRLDVLVGGRLVEPLSQIVPREETTRLGHAVLLKLKETIQRHQFVVVLQAAVGSRIIAREEIPALRKNVLAKMSGGHRERKDKLLERQREGKKRLKRIGSVEIPQEAFRVILRS